MPHTLFAFSEPDAANRWQTVNDGVMGGVSEGRFMITGTKTLKFFGNLSLENNGGFASVRSRPQNLGLEKGDSVIVHLRGDGREYSLNLYLQTSRMAFSYRAAVQTKKDEWIEVKLPLDKFVATSFGRVVTDAGPVPPGTVNALGFMVSDKQPGPFQLEIASIQRERAREGSSTRVNGDSHKE